MTQAVEPSRPAVSKRVHIALLVSAIGGMSLAGPASATTQQRHATLLQVSGQLRTLSYRVTERRERGAVTHQAFYRDADKKAGGSYIVVKVNIHDSDTSATSAFRSAGGHTSGARSFAAASRAVAFAGPDTGTGERIGRVTYLSGYGKAVLLYPRAIVEVFAHQISTHERGATARAERRVEQQRLADQGIEPAISAAKELDRAIGALLAEGRPSAPNPCEIDDFQWDEQLLGRAFDEAASKVQSQAVRAALLRLYREKVPFGPGGAPVRLRPGQIMKVLNSLGAINAGIQSVDAATSGEFTKASAIVARFGAEAFLESRGVPLVGLLSFALDIVMISDEAAERQEKLLRRDLAFYQFLDDSTLQRQLDEHPTDAVRHYIASRLAQRGAEGKAHRQMFQDYIDLAIESGQLAAGEGATINSRLIDLFPAAVGLRIQDPKLRTLVLTMLRDFEIRREQTLPAGQQTRIRRRFAALQASAAFRDLQTLAKALASYPVLMEEICRSYQKMQSSSSP